MTAPKRDPHAHCRSELDVFRAGIDGYDHGWNVAMGTAIDVLMYLDREQAMKVFRATLAQHRGEMERRKAERGGDPGG